MSAETPAPPTAEPVRSPSRIFLGRLIRNRPAMTGAVMLVILYLMALFGSFLAPYDPNLSRTDAPDHPPARLHFSDKDGRFHLRPFIYRTELRDILRRTYTVDNTYGYPIRLLVRAEPYELWWLFKTNLHLFGVGWPRDEAAAAEAKTKFEEPPRVFLFGSDRVGRDIFSRVLSGSQISLSIGLIGITITMTLGLLVGGLSGFLGGIPDVAIMRIVELIMSIPGLYLILALRAALSESNPMLEKLFRLKPDEPLGSGKLYMLMVIILGFVSWAGTARVIRGMVLSIKKLDFVSAARVLGASRLRIIVFHLLPNTLTYVIISATLSVPYYILGEVALSYLGVGIEEPQASWGNMLHEAQSIRALVDFPWLLIPGVFIFITVFAFNFFGDGVRDALDPKYLR